MASVRQTCVMDVVQQLKARNKRLVFSVTTGRSGTAYLTEHLARLSGADVFHEPVPAFHTVMRQVQNDPDLARTFWLDEKLPAILAQPAPFYIETGHVFCKGFFEPLVALGLRPDLILLSRPARQVALSLLRLDTIPARSEKGLRWLLSPADPAVQPPTDWQQLNDYQLCYWYCLEIERRQDAYARQVQAYGGRVSRVTLGGIRDGDDFARLVRELDLPKPSLLSQLKFYWRRKQHVNKKSAATAANLFSDDELDAFEAIVRNQFGRT